MRPTALYRHILRLHRTVLPYDLRFVGDAYVKDEFRKHRTAASTFLGPFFRSWNEYLQMLQTESAAQLPGRPLSDTDLSKLTESQLKQLSLLKREATRKLRQSSADSHSHAHGHVHGPNCKH